MDLQRLSTPTALRLLAGVLGLATYSFYYRRGEHHLHPERNLQILVVLYFLVTLGLRHLNVALTAPDAFPSAANIIGVYVAGIYAGVTVYRLFLNPLNKFPGYPLAKLTAFDHSFRVGKNKDMYLKLYDCHQKWGKFVRIGPNDLSVSDADVVRVALASQAKCTKAPWYSIEHPAYSIHSTRNRADHDRRRRIWSPAFSDKALRGYEDRVAKYNELLIKQINEISGKPINISKWFYFWSFDVMGDLAFGQSFKMLESAQGHWTIDLLNSSQRGAGLSLPPWSARLLLAIPGARCSHYKFLRFCSEQIESRMLLQGNKPNPDITHFLIEDFSAKSMNALARKAELGRLHVDSKLIIVAGSDTTAATVTFLFYHLARDPSLLGRLREEIEGLTGGHGEHIEHKKIQSAPLLNGCINEVLRLHPPVLSGLYRKTPPEGVYVGEQWIPGNTVLQVNFYSIGRDESHFVKADEFIPERFSTRPELIKHTDAFVPFSTGPYGCIGKNLALMELRLLTARLISEFDVAFAPGEDGIELLKSADHFTIGLKPLNLLFKRRDKESVS